LAIRKRRGDAEIGEWRIRNLSQNNNRADNAYIPGAVIPGYIIIKPDFPECIDNFGFLWFEHEAVVAGSANVAGNAVDAIIKESK
jgi:endoglucanase